MLIADFRDHTEISAIPMAEISGFRGHNGGTGASGGDSLAHNVAAHGRHTWELQQQVVPTESFGPTGAALNLPLWSLGLSQIVV